MTVPILDETADEVVVWKPPRLASELPRDPSADSLARRLIEQGFDGLRLVHRLDAPACGVMVVARTVEAAAHYSAEIAARRWHKVYVAEVASGQTEANGLIGEHRAYLNNDGHRSRLVRSGGKPSSLSVIHAAATADPNRSHVLVRLHTGRFHQIRVMLASLGAPLVGDVLYGGPAGVIYLEHVCLAARPFGEEQTRSWRSPDDVERPRWPASLVDAISKEIASINQG